MWALVTGSGRGLGRGIALGLAERGYSIILHARDNSHLKETEQLVRKFDVKTKLVVGDLEDDATLEQLIKVSSELKAELLVNNAGIPCPGKPLEELADSEMKSLLRVNLEVPMALCHAFWPRLKAAKIGTIVNINSMVGIEPKLNRSVYTAVRFGLRGFTEALALEARACNVRIFGVYPTRVRSRPEYEYGFEVEEVVQRILEFIDSGNETALILDGRPK